LDVDEASRLLNDRFGLDLDATSVQSLCRRTEGWPAALHLAGLSLQTEPNRRRFVERFAGDDRNIVDYLTAEVLQRVGPSRRAFLLRTSVLDRLNGPLCDAVAGTTDSAATLQDLERDNLFVIPLDNRRTWYRYHRLFGEWLRHELRRNLPDSIPELHARASRWYEERGSFEPAITHAIEAGEHERAGGLIDRALTEWGRVNWSRLGRWLAELPHSVIERHPMAAIAVVGFSLATGDFATGLRWIPIAESAIPRAPDELRPAIESRAALFRAVAELVAGDMDVARVSFEEMADSAEGVETGDHAVAVGLAGVATFWSIGALEAIPALQEGAVARELASLADAGVTATLAAAYAEVGDWTAAEMTAREALAQPRPDGHYQYPDLFPARVALGRALVARGDREDGISEIEQGLELARRWVEPIFIAYGCLALAAALDGYTEKRALVREARQLIEGGRGRGRIGDLVTAAERKLALRQPSRHAAGAVHVEPLTERERDVVRLLATDLSLREIAGELFLSHNTVKGHTKAIYRKLGVSSRAAAIEAARDLDVL
jgi:LuxR family maltose regulon positive regulatory protein